jgi:transposase
LPLLFLEKEVKIKRVLDSINSRRLRRLLRGLFHRGGPGRKPYNPLSILKAQLLKHLLRIPSDRRLSLRLKHDRRAARACGFRKRTPSHSLFTHFRHRLGEETYLKIFNHILRRLIDSGVVKGDVVAVDSTHLKAYSQRSKDNKTGRSDSEARVGRGKRGFILGYRVHTACCAESEMPLAFTIAPCNENDKTYFKPLLERVHGLGIRFEAVVADAQYSSRKVREAAEAYGAETVIPVRRDSRVKEALRVGKDFIVRGAHRLVELFKRRMSVERLFSRAKEWLMLSSLRVRGLQQVAIHAALSLTAMLAIALTAIQRRQPELIRSIKHFTA